MECGLLTLARKRVRGSKVTYQGHLSDLQPLVVGFPGPGSHRNNRADAAAPCLSGVLGAPPDRGHSSHWMPCMSALWELSPAHPRPSGAPTAVIRVTLNCALIGAGHRVSWGHW